MRSFWSPVVLAFLGGLLLLGAVGGDWRVVQATRSVGGLDVPETMTTAGTDAAPWLVPLGLAALVGGALLATLRGRVRAAAGVAVAVAGALAAFATLTGVTIGDGAGDTTGAPAVAGGGAALLLLAGVLGVVAPRRPASRTRYTVDAADRTIDDEWALASDDDETT